MKNQYNNINNQNKIFVEDFKKSQKDLNDQNNINDVMFVNQHLDSINLSPCKNNRQDLLELNLSSNRTEKIGDKCDLRY